MSDGHAYYKIRETTIDGPVIEERGKLVRVTLICQLIPMGRGTRESPRHLHAVDFGGPVVESDDGPIPVGALFITAPGGSLVQVVAVRGEKYEVRLRWSGARDWSPVGLRYYTRAELTAMERLA